jgi:hypothetical protein
LGGILVAAIARRREFRCFRRYPTERWPRTKRLSNVWDLVIDDRQENLNVAFGSILLKVRQAKLGGEGSYVKE